MKKYAYDRQTNRQTYLGADGRIPTFFIDEWINILEKLPQRKPSRRIISSKMGKRAIKALQEIKEIDNESWYKFLKKRSANCWNETALFYRGNKITFEEMFENADALAAAMTSQGVKPEEEIGVCVTNTPELVYILLAANRIGVKVNIFSSNFDKKYLMEITDDLSKKIIFISDDNYLELQEVFLKKDFEIIIVSSLNDSLPTNYKQCEEYVPWLDEYYHFENRIPKIKMELENAVAFQDFLDVGCSYDGDKTEYGNLETDFLISYTSGSTKTGNPKAIIHKNRSLITMGKFHDPKLSGNPKVEGLRGLAHIHPESNTDIITCISDNLIQGWSVALEPLYDINRYIDYVFLNRPNYLNATTSFNINMAKQYLNSSKYTGKKMPFLLALFNVGESTSPGEEKYINLFLKTARAGCGIRIMGFSFPYTTVSIGGGDCEHGGVFYTLWRSMFQILYRLRLHGHSLGMFPVPYAVVTALRKNECGDYEECNYEEIGILVTNSYTNFSGYKKNYEATNDLILKDIYGRKWVSNTVYGYIDRVGSVHQKGRIHSDTSKEIETYEIDDVILKKSDIIMSSSTIKLGDRYVTSIQCNSGVNLSVDEVIHVYRETINDSMLDLNLSKMYVRIIPFEESFPLTDAGKRSISALELMQFENAFSVYCNE